jgi:GLPGLI family protein
MRKIIVLLFSFYSLISFAQTASDSVVLRIYYASQTRKTIELKNLSPDEKVLDIGRHQAHFYSRWNERNRDINDSVFSSGGKLADYYKAKDASGFPNPPDHYNVFMNYPQAGQLVFTDFNLKFFRYKENMVMPQWEVQDGDTTIADYPCKKAKTTFRGRSWIVWYTMDIPYSYGPWKLYGLPGLILQAKDIKGDFTFSCIGIEKGKGQTIVMRDAKYIECSPEKYEELVRLEWNDPDQFISSMGFPASKGYDQQGRPIVRKPRVPCLLEYRLKSNK